MPQKVPSEIGELKALAHDPTRQTRRAAELIAARKGNAVVQAALDVLIRSPLPDAKPALFDLYATFTRHETRDPACYVRSQIVQALRPLAAPRDVDFFWSAAETYAFPPPQFTEEAGLLRANALLVLEEVDRDVACFAATRLLFDEHTAPMSGEPAVAAAQVLGRLEVLLPLYAYVMQPADHVLEEVGAQALRSLSALPQPMLGQVIRRYTAAQEPPLASPLVAGMFDLLLALDPIPEDGRAFLWAFLRENSPLDLYRYLATLLATANSEPGWALLEDIVQMEDVPARLRILREAVEIAPDTRRAGPIAERLTAKLT